jgi:dihydroflavonol-4-reductase
MTNSASDGERFIVSEKEMWLHESAKVLNDNGYKAPTKVMPNWLVRFIAIFKGDMVAISKMVGKNRDCHSTKAKDVLGWDPRPAEESILDTAKQIKEFNLI